MKKSKIDTMISKLDGEKKPAESEIYKTIEPVTEL